MGLNDIEKICHQWQNLFSKVSPNIKNFVKFYTSRNFDKNIIAISERNINKKMKKIEGAVSKKRV